MEKIKRLKESLWKNIKENKEVLFCAFLGAVVFVFIYGPHILDPGYTD